MRPQWLGLLAVVLVAASAMAWLGNWQLARAREHGGSAQLERLQRPAEPLGRLMNAHARFPATAADHPVTVTGQWEGAGQLLVTPRAQDGVTGYWVLTPIRLPDGTAIGVVRGFTRDPQTAATSLPTGEVTVTGVLRPGEAAAERDPGQGSGLPAGEIDRIDPVELIARWQGSLFTGYVVADPDAAVQGSGTGALTPVPQISQRSGLALQNLSYAVQWWIFAAFGLIFWWRLVRDDHRGMLADGPADSPRGGDVPVAESRQ